MITMRFKVARRLEVQQESRYGVIALGFNMISASGFNANGGGSKLKQQKFQENGYDPIWNPNAATLEITTSKKKNVTFTNVGLQISYENRCRSNEQV